MEKENMQAESIIDNSDLQEVEMCPDCGEALIECKCQQGGH